MEAAARCSWAWLLPSPGQINELLYPGDGRSRPTSPARQPQSTSGKRECRLPWVAWRRLGRHSLEVLTSTDTLNAPARADKRSSQYF